MDESEDGDSADGKDSSSSSSGGILSGPSGTLDNTGFEGEFRFTSTDGKAIATKIDTTRMTLFRETFDVRAQEDQPWMSTAATCLDIAEMNNQQGSTRNALACMEIAQCFTDLAITCKNMTRELYEATGLTMDDIAHALAHNEDIKAAVNKLHSSIKAGGKVVKAGGKTVVNKIQSSSKAGKNAFNKNIERGSKNFDKFARPQDLIKFIQEWQNEVQTTAITIGNITASCITSPTYCANLLNAVGSKMTTENGVALFVGIHTNTATNPLLLLAAATGGLGVVGLMGGAAATQISHMKKFLSALHLETSLAGMYSNHPKVGEFVATVNAVVNASGQQVISKLAEKVPSTAKKTFITAKKPPSSSGSGIQHVAQKLGKAVKKAKEGKKASDVKPTTKGGSKPTDIKKVKEDPASTPVGRRDQKPEPMY